MQNYLNALHDIMFAGEDRVGRNGKTRALFAIQSRWDLREGFPAVTTKELKFRSVVGELLWFLSGSTNDIDLKKIMGYPPEKNTIWSANAKDFEGKKRATCTGDLGLIYGHQWRNWNGQLDQIADVIERLRTDPNDRRLIVTAWNPTDIPYMALPACHVMFQLFSHPDGGLSLSMCQRSCDFFLGVPFNIASYALLLHILAQVTGRYARELVITFQDAHIYEEHFPVVVEQLRRQPFKLPTLIMNNAVKEIGDFTIDDFNLHNYQHHDALKAAMIV